jgi:hypothetical protein
MYQEHRQINFSLPVAEKYPASTSNVNYLLKDICFGHQVITQTKPIFPSPFVATMD